MSLSIGSRRFAPQAWAIALTAVLVAAFVSLGWWQIGRAHEKRALIEAFERGANTSARSTGLSSTGCRATSACCDAAYEPARQILLDNMPSSTGQPGYRVLTPFRRDGAERPLLVDRGWVPLGATRQQLPDVAVDAGPRTVAGRLDGLPVPGVRVGEAQAAGEARLAAVLNFPIVADVEAALGEPVESRIVLLDASQPRTASSAAGARRSASPPERHLGYAIQWFALGRWCSSRLRRDSASQRRHQGPASKRP